MKARRYQTSNGFARQETPEKAVCALRLLIGISFQFAGSYTFCEFSFPSLVATNANLNQEIRYKQEISAYCCSDYDENYHQCGLATIMPPPDFSASI
jgi:hypothetical protein